MQILLASNNSKKLAELQRIVADNEALAGRGDIEVIGTADAPAYDEPVEDGRTFSDNALIKARAGARNTGLVTIADDSGLAVDELAGMPGVLSARWCGEHGNDAANNELLLAQLADVPDERRSCAFVSVCALVTPDGQEHVVEGRWEGQLLRSPRGENGFGYDPLFVPDTEIERAGSIAQARSSAQLSPDEKNAASHRGKALAQLVPVLVDLLD
ncbi:non-canonical purine NTP pyrophosphatase [Corynebacterium sp.]|uniref:non-canonical purine NTP pyrophosphatase n=1 Tax=Corynebacterium sp. TaxID=1720 RepID=UPI0027BAB8A4|nr:non-canonical purine NTP pyrophosphatase [Corynebacterium sp.]